MIRLQETPGFLIFPFFFLSFFWILHFFLLDTVPDGQTPHTITLLAFDDLVDVPRPGDK